MTLTVGSLFSGIGGLDLGLERAGMQVIWQSEIEPYACKVLKKHWPEVVNHGDIKQINWEEVERPNVICGGYPCQPFSTAGKRRGEEDPRHLWPWVREAISRLRPDYAILENVRGHLSMGGLSVIAELATIGYDAEWRVVSAASVGANHRRDRIIIVAYPDSNNTANGRQCKNVQSQNPIGGNDGAGSWSDIRQISVGEAGQDSSLMANSNCQGRQGSSWIQEREQESCRFDLSSPNLRWSQTLADNERQWHGQHRLEANAGQENRGRLFDGRREEAYVGWQWWESEPDVGRVANGVPNRVDRLRGLGNAVVPQVAEVIGRLVVEHANA